jgi:hypothetical protein
MLNVKHLSQAAWPGRCVFKVLAISEVEFANNPLVDEPASDIKRGALLKNVSFQTKADSFNDRVVCEPCPKGRRELVETRAFQCWRRVWATGVFNAELLNATAVN